MSWYLFSLARGLSILSLPHPTPSTPLRPVGGLYGEIFGERLGDQRLGDRLPPPFPGASPPAASVRRRLGGAPSPPTSSRPASPGGSCALEAEPRFSLEAEPRVLEAGKQRTLDERRPKRTTSDGESAAMTGLSQARNYAASHQYASPHAGAPPCVQQRRLLMPPPSDTVAHEPCPSMASRGSLSRGALRSGPAMAQQTQPLTKPLAGSPRGKNPPPPSVFKMPNRLDPPV